MYLYMNDKVAGELIDQVAELKKNYSDLKYNVKELTEKMDQFCKMRKTRDNINDWVMRYISNLYIGLIATNIAIIGLAIVVLFLNK